MPDRFRAELRRILRGVGELETVEIDDPASHGWLRRPELDRAGAAAWERPDGAIRGIAARPAAGRRTGRGPEPKG